MKNFIEKLKEPKCLKCKIFILSFFLLILTSTDLIVKEIATRKLKDQFDVVVIDNFWHFHYVVNDDIG
ncbi:MAG: hypothetical protein MJB14_20920, partial [Spirochaetes bacterium]|nr:hypothetical protein [Spirochaetota bacterium]